MGWVDRAPSSVLLRLHRLLDADDILLGAYRRALEFRPGDGATLLGPGNGSQACGETGDGRMLEAAELCEDLIAFMEVSTGGAVVGKDRSEFEAASGDEGEFVHSTFEGFHRDSTGEAVRATGIGAVDGAAEMTDEVTVAGAGALRTGSMTVSSASARESVVVTGDLLEDSRISSAFADEAPKAMAMATNPQPAWPVRTRLFIHSRFITAPLLIKIEPFALRRIATAIPKR
jgi:hypothetical protein